MSKLVNMGDWKHLHGLESDPFENSPLTITEDSCDIRVDADTALYHALLREEAYKSLLFGSKLWIEN